MKILVVGNCTGSKDAPGCPEAAKLIEAEFDDAALLRRREQELSMWLKPAAEMYIGRQHTQMMDGVRLIRSMSGSDACDVAILSAGYGLISERQPIVPYNVTFKKMGTPRIRERGEKLGIPRAMRKLIADYPVVFFLLGDEYLLSTLPPLSPIKDQKFVHFGSPKLREVRGPDVVTVPAAHEAAREFGDRVIYVKGRMFHLLAAGLKQKPKMLDEVVQDRTPATVLALMQAGKNYA
jgi:hypothetical protein